MKLKQLMGIVNKTCEDYNLIEENDKIAIGISGGKDSLMLLTCMANLRKYYPKKFEIVAISIDLFNGETDYTELQKYCDKLDVKLKVVKSNIKKIVFDIKKEPNPCSLCANLRRGFLNTTAKKLGCNKVALGHHADDLIETYFMSLFFESRMHLFLPKTKLTNNTLYVIRPLILVYEEDIIKLSRGLPVIKNKCPADKHTQRQAIKEMITGLTKTMPFVKKNVLSAITHPDRNYLFDKIKERLKDTK